MVTQAEIPKGYRKTEIGVIPGDWGVDRIKNLASITTGARNTQDKIEDGENPFFVRSQTVERINSYSFDGEAVLTAGDGVGTGKVFHYINGKFDLHQRVYKISDFKKALDGRFFFFYFSNHFLNRIMQMTAKSSVDSVRMEMIADMQIPLPPHPEQTAVALAINDIEELITKLEELITKKRNVKQGAMQELLTGKKRLPGFSGKWEVKPFGEILSRINAKEYQVQTSDYQETGKYPVVDQGKDLVIGYSDREDKGFRCPKGGVIVFGDHTCIIKFIDFDFVVGADGTQIMVAKRQHCTRFYAFQLEYCGIPTTGYNRHFKFLKERTFFSPNFDEQFAIAQVLSDMDAEIDDLEQKLDKYKMIKQGMMQELLTGRTRLI